MAVLYVRSFIQATTSKGVDENEEPDDSSSEILWGIMLWSINLGQSVLVPYQLSASSYATVDRIL